MHGSTLANRDDEVASPKLVTYDDRTPTRFMAASVIWGVVGMLVALQLAWTPANVHPMLSFGRLRPLHTNAVIVASVGKLIFAGIYHSSQRRLKARLAASAVVLAFGPWSTMGLAGQLGVTPRESTHACCPKAR